jgi:hypothetical protein
MKKSTKLQLNRETLHALTLSERLRDAAGGATKAVGCTLSCAGSCAATCIVSCLDAVCTTTDSARVPCTN